MVDRQGEGNVAHMSWAMNSIESTGPTQFLLVAGAQSKVVQTPLVGVEKAVKRVWVENSLTADFFDFFPGVGQKANGGEAHRGPKARVQASSVHHGNSSCFSFRSPATCFW